MFPQKDVRLDVRALLDGLPFSSAEIPGLLQIFGYPVVGYKAVRRWHQDNSIPPHRLAALLAICEASGVRLDVNDYVVIEPVAEPAESAEVENAA